MIIERNSEVRVHYAGAPRPNAAAGAAREYKLSRLPGLVVAGRTYMGFSVKGLQVPRGATIRAYLGNGLFEAIEKWPEADQARAVRNLIAFIEESKPLMYGAYRGIQATITESMGSLTQVKIGFAAKSVFDPVSRPQEPVELGVDLEFSSGGSCFGKIELRGGKAEMWHANYEPRLPAGDLLAILRFQG